MGARVDCFAQVPIARSRLAALQINDALHNQNMNKNEANEQSKDEFWIFGYGSLIYKTDFPIEKEVTGYIKGFTRRFYQGSNDHRGTPEALGRVVTLISADEYEQLPGRHHDPHEGTHVVWGKAYRVPEDQKEQVKAQLDFREKNGYSVHHLPVYSLMDVVLEDKEQVVLVEDDEKHVYNHKQEVCLVKSAMVYIATTNNESFLGPAPLIDIATQIVNSSGPSGRNDEYLLKLAQSLRSFPGGEDAHVFELEKLVLELKKP